MRHCTIRLALLFAAALLFSAHGAQAQEAAPLSKGQNLYLPIYSQIWHGNFDRDGKPAQVGLSVLVSVRNRDPQHPLRVVAARYFDSAGRLLANYVAAEKTLPPLGSTEFFVERKEAKGGSGASLLIRWEADQAINPPLVEAVHTEVLGTRALSFTTTATPLRSGD